MKPPKGLLIVALTEVFSTCYILSGPLTEKPTGEMYLVGEWGQQDQSFAFHERIVYFYLKGIMTFLNDHMSLFTLATRKWKARFATEIWQLNRVIG